MMGCFIGVGSRRRRTSSDGQECAVRANGINGFSAKVKGVALLVTVIVALLMLATPMRAQAASFAEETVADPSTQNSYESLIGNPEKGYVTENVGRIWPDKTVSTGNIQLKAGNNAVVEKDDAEDFLVMLSALSSTSNTQTWSLSRSTSLWSSTCRVRCAKASAPDISIRRRIALLSLENITP